MKTPGWPGNCGSSAFQIKLTIVAVIGPKEYCKLKNKFWKVSKKSRIRSWIWSLTICNAAYIKNKAYIHTTFKKCKLWVR